MEEPLEGQSLHPLILEYYRLLNILLPDLMKERDDKQIIEFLEKHMMLVGNRNGESYRNLIKGYHLAFHVRQPANMEDISKYKYKLPTEMSAEEIRLKVAEAKHKRFLERKQKEIFEKARYEK